MSSLRNILQRCARNASILGGIPIQVQCAITFNPVCLDPTYISRQTYSSDANEAPKNANDNVQKYILEMMNSKKSQSNIAADQEASNGKEASASNSPAVNKNLNLRKYYIGINGLSKKTTPESLREFYSQFGEIAYCNIIFKGKPNSFGSVAFTSRKAMDRALNSLPHCIDDKVIRNVRPGVLGRNHLTLQVVVMSLKTTSESLKAFYSKFGRLQGCSVEKATSGIRHFGEVTFAYQIDMHRALDAQPHVIDGTEVFLKYATYDLDLWIPIIPESVTQEQLVALYSKYGQLRRCRFFKGKYEKSHAYVSYSAVDEVNRAMDDRPHIINGKPLRVDFVANSHNSNNFSVFVGSLPETVTEETLLKEFSKYGKPVYWEFKNDGRYNQSGPYGHVAYSTKQEALNALNSGPHMIEGSVVDVRKAKDAGKL